jgi:hypothetical protein
MSSSFNEILNIGWKHTIESMDYSFKKMLSINSQLSIDSLDSMNSSQNSSTNSLKNITKPIDIPSCKKNNTKNIKNHIHSLNYYLMLNVTDNNNNINIPCNNCGKLFISKNCYKFCSGECYYSNTYYKYNRFIL